MSTSARSSPRSEIAITTIEKRTEDMDTTIHRTMVLWAMGMALVLGLVALAAFPALAAPNTVDPDTLTPPPPPGAQCKDTGNYVICQTFFDESWANQPDFTLSCGRAYSTGSVHREGIRWYSDGLLVRRFVTATDTGTLSLSPTGEGPTVTFVSHLNWVDHYAVPGDEDSATEIEHGLDFRIWRPGSGVMVRLAGIFMFVPDGGVTHHGAGEFAIDEEDNLVIPAKTDAALCEALVPE